LEKQVTRVRFKKSETLNKRKTGRKVGRLAKTPAATGKAQNQGDLCDFPDTATTSKKGKIVEEGLPVILELEGVSKKKGQILPPAGQLFTELETWRAYRSKEEKRKPSFQSWRRPYESKLDRCGALGGGQETLPASAKKKKKEVSVNVRHQIRKRKENTNGQRKHRRGTTGLGKGSDLGEADKRQELSTDRECS